MVVPDEPPPEEAKVQDLLGEATMLRHAGLSLGDEGTFLLLLSLKALAVARGGEVRFWGKLVTRSGDYFVAEMPTVEFPDDNDVLKMEGTNGPNKSTYFASKSPSDAGSWQALPHVTPAQIVVARQVKRSLSGDLAAPVPSFPPFPDGGLEANLVRAMVALISSETVLSLDGLLRPGDDEEEAAIIPNDEAEEGATKSVEELQEMGAWVHAELDINAAGRTQKTPLPAGEDGEPVDDPEASDEPPDEPPKPPLEPIAGDVGPDEKPLWVLRACPGGVLQSASSVVVAKSLKWPGAVAVAAGSKVVNLYVGFGVPKATMNAPYQPPAVRPVQGEWAAPEEEDPQLRGFPIEEKDEIFKPKAPEEEAED